MYRREFTVLSLVLVILSANSVSCASSQRTNEPEQNCDLVRPFFEMRNISLQFEEDRYGPVCSGKCCGVSTEVDLRHQVQRDFSSLLRHNSRSLQGLLDTTASILQDHVMTLTRQSENKTLGLFSTVYRGMAVLSQDPTNALYSDIRRFVQVNGSQDSFTTLNIDLKTSVLKFFTDLFPLVYHHTLNTQQARDFTSSYKVCLRETINEVKPFGDIPRQIAQSLSKSLEATRLLLQAFGVGVEVLNTTESLLTEEASEGECHEALLKMTYCPKCLGLLDQTKPCSGYCLNVLRGCLTKHVAELDSPWNGFVEAIERLVIAWKQHNNEAGVNADAVIRALETRISEAIMYTMENSLEMDKRVKKACGLPKFSDKEVIFKPTTDESASSGKPTKPQRMNMSMRDQHPPPETQLLHFLTSVAKSRGFYTNLADNLCKDESFAETKDQNCWNGQRIGEYTKTVVGAGIGMQKYNPELKFGSEVQNGDPKIANLADKLRHVHNMVITSLGTVNLPESDSFMQGDAADGSGSGHGGPHWPDDEDEFKGSGSGDGPDGGEDGTKHRTMTEKPHIQTHEETVNTGGSTAVRATQLATLLLSLLPILRYYG